MAGHDIFRGDAGGRSTWVEDAAEGPGTTPAGAGRYAPGEELGRGGLGRVRVAWDHALRREVALKELLHDGPGQRRRFEREARLTALLDHPAIVPVHDVGRDAEGRPFYAMKRLHGRPLSAALREAGGLAGRLAYVEALITACQAVAYAHSRGVVHRDLKPENLVVGGFGETWVVDWGLAARFGDVDTASADGTPIPDEPALTAVGAVVGTPAYLSPEQARGEPAAPSADVWALGAVLYTILTGAPPYDGEPTQLLAIAREGRPRRVADRAPDAPGALVAVCERAMAPALADRYPAAADLAADLRAWAQGRAVSAYEYPASEAIALLFRRYRTWWLGGAVAAAVLGGVVGSAYWQVVQQRDIANDAVAAQRVTLTGRYADAARESLRDDDLHAAERLAAEALRYGEDPVARGVLAAARGQRGARLVGARTAEEGCLAFAAQGERTACGSNAGLTVDDGLGGGFVFSGARVRAVAFAPDGRVAALTTSELHVFDPEGRALERRPVDAPHPFVAFDPAGRAVVEESSLPRAGDRPRWCGSALSAAFWEPDGAVVATCVRGLVVRIAAGAEAPDPWTDLHEVSYVAIPLSGDRVGVGRGDDLAILDRATLAWQADLPGLGGYLTGAAESRDGAYVAGINDRGRPFVWSARDAAIVERLPGMGEGIGAVAFAPDGTLWVAGVAGVRRWALPARRPDRLDRGPVDFAVAAGRAFETTADLELWTWELRAGAAAREPIPARAADKVVTNEGWVWFLERWDGVGVLRALDAVTLEERVPPTTLGRVANTTLEPCGDGIAVGDGRGTVRVVDRSGAVVLTLEGDLLDGVRAGLVIRHGGAGRFVRPDGSEVLVDVPPQTRIALAEDGSRLAWEGDGHLVVVDLRSGARREVARAMRAGSLTFTPDGRWLVVAEWTGHVDVRDPVTLARVAELPGAEARFGEVVFQGDTAVAYDWLGAGWRWDLGALDRDPDALLAEATARTGLTLDEEGRTRFDPALLRPYAAPADGGGPE